MPIKEIEKLREKVDKDPNSKLFVPLAEEYRKEGMADEAIEVLRKGLEIHPGYMSARVSLGKIYLEKGKMEEARIEFESVIKSIPDNLYAHKKLAEIYRDTGERGLAVKAFRTVLKLNPMDEDILRNLQDIEAAYTEQPAGIIQASGVSSEEKAVAAEEENPLETLILENNSHEQPRGEPAESGEAIDAFKESLFGNKTEAGEEITGEIPAITEDTGEGEELAEEADEEWSFGKTAGAPASGAVEEDITGAEEIPEEADDELSFGDMADVLKTEGLETVEDAETISGDSGASEEVFSEEVSPETDYRSLKGNSELLQTAERLISEGNYSRAINIYHQMLVTTPDDKHTLQRIDELRSLLKLLGKDKEVLVSELNAFLSAIKVRGDEFFRSS